MSKLTPRCIALLLLVTLAACAGSRAGSPREAGRTDRLTQADIGDTAYSDLYEFVLAKRASWLRPRGRDSLVGNPSQVVVYVDDVRVGGVEALRTVHPMEIEYVRYFDPIQASSRWGFDHGSGAIYVVTRTN